MIHRPGDAQKYHEIASRYRTLGNPVTGFFGAKGKDGQVVAREIQVVDDDYPYEGTMRQYRLTVPFDLTGQTALIGGKEKSPRS